MLQDQITAQDAAIGAFRMFHSYDSGPCGEKNTARPKGNQVQENEREGER